MPGYATKQQQITIRGVDDLTIRSLLDRRQFADPLGEAHRLGISSASWPMFGLLWPSGAQLAARLAMRPVHAGERILEIGCGLALASLVGPRIGADMTASDCHPLAAAFLRENLRLNELPPMKYRHGQWQGPSALSVPTEEPASQILQSRYDLVIGSDLLYERDDAGSLAGFIDRHASTEAEVWIVDPDRVNRSAFNRHMAANAFSRSEERLDRPASSGGPAAYKGRLMVYRRCGAGSP
jgi:predicted nicotinamide N-methyase